MSEPSRITSYAHDTDVINEGLALFYRVFRGSPKLQALASAYLKQLQDVEDALWAMLTESSLATATYDQLDQLGALENVPRSSIATSGTFGDDAYRRCLRGIVAARRSRGYPEDVINAARLMLGHSNFSYVEGAASLYVEPHQPIVASPSYVPTAELLVLQTAAPAGVQAQLISPPDVEANLFAFSDDPFRAKADPVAGFSDTTQTTGGLWTGVIA